MRRIRWYLDRLAAMSLPEIAYRVRQRALVDWGRVSLPARTSDLEYRTGGKDWLTFSEGKFRHPVSLFLQQKSLKRFYCESYPEEYAATVEYAEKLLKHTVKIFGRYVDLGEKINWSQDFITRRIWPDIYWADIDIRDGKTVGGVKWVWELNRHHHLVTLGKAYVLSGQKKYAQELLGQLSSWITANPSRKGVNWTSSLELAVRLINWSWALNFVRLSPLITEELFSRIMISIEEQASHIERHLSAYSSANNHRIGEAAGLAITGLSFPWLSRAGEWIDKGFRILTQEIERQIYPDGVPAEQAIHYLTFILDFYILAWQMAGLNDLQVPEIWYNRLSAACEFIKIIMDENGGIPRLGDSDDAWVVKLDDRVNPNNFRSILATTSALLKRADLKALSGSRWDEKSFWLMGYEGWTTFQSLTSFGTELNSHHFESGGYCVMRDLGKVIVFDCGPLGFLSLAAHGHADALSLTASINGTPILVDPGTYAYQEGSPWRDYFRSTSAHNSVVVDGENQSEASGAFLWGRKAKSKLVNWKSTPEYDLAIAEHNGYKGLGVNHQRIVFFNKPDWIIVQDDLTGHGEHDFEQLWHLPADSSVDLKSAYLEMCTKANKFFIIPLRPADARINIFRGEEQPIQGWISPSYGKKVPAPVISIAGNVELPVRIVTAIYLNAHSKEYDLVQAASQFVKEGFTQFISD